MQDPNGKRALILGTHSFVDGGTKVGSQYLAEGLAKLGWRVSYLATASSLFDVWGSSRRQRLKRVWLGSQAVDGVSVAPGLTEFAFKSPFPANRLFLRCRWQLDGFGWLLPGWLRTTTFDACVSDVTPNMVFLPWVSARVKVLRLNDWPAGFARDLHPVLMEYMENGLLQASFDEVWAISNPLVKYAQNLNSRNKVIHMPNGVDLEVEPSDVAVQRETDSAVYVGGLTAWFDLPLLERVAVLLPQWKIHVYAPGAEQLHRTESNLHFHGPVGRADVPALLARHEVGLIPFNNVEGRMSFVERPLKFYEYIVAGLGVASTDYGALQEGMAGLAAYGNTPEGFAAAMVAAREQAARRRYGFATQFAQQHAWRRVVENAECRMNALLGAGKEVVL